MNDTAASNVENLDAVELQTVAIEAHDRLTIVSRALADLLQDEGLSRDQAATIGGASCVVGDVLRDLDEALDR